MYLKQCVKNFIGTKIPVGQGYHEYITPIGESYVTNHTRPISLAPVLSDFFVLNSHLILSCDRICVFHNPRQNSYN